MASISKLEYLKRYMSEDSKGDDKKRKKKKLHKILKANARVKIVDDDVDLKSLSTGNLENTLEEDVGDNDPTVAEIIDERPEHVKTLERYRQDDRWRTLGSSENDESGNEKNTKRSPALRKQSLVRNKRHDSDSDQSPVRNKRHDSHSDQSPDRNKRHDSDSDQSPVRNKRHDSDSDQSPVRTKRHDSDSDQSPVRNKRHDSDSDQSPVRNKRPDDSDSDQSPKRSNLSFGKNRKGQPQSKRHLDSDQSPLRKGKHQSDSDQSPPRKEKHQSDSDESPPRKGKHQSDSDQSPPRKGKPQSDSDQSPPRKRKPDFVSEKSSSRKTQGLAGRSNPRMPVGKSPEGKPVKTLSGARAGLSSAKDVRKETESLRRKHDAAFNNIDEDLLGRNAKTVFRDRKTGKRRNMKAEQDDQEAELAKKREEDAKYERWGKGLRQQSKQEEAVKDAMHEMSKPLARSRDDADLDKMMRDLERDGDPMAAFIKKKKTGDKKERPQYKGPYPPNRFGIRPGYRWDGVDRSNGFEKQYFAKMADKRATDHMAYKWSTEDM